jgi:threonylcarbamoyladenosine tRNA methylthiotransferase MtaB
MASIDGLQRVRLASVNPSGITTDLLDACAAHPTVCPHFHVPLQSGDDRILSAMARDYDKTTYLATIQRIRDRIPSATLGTDLIVGFPGEDDVAFEHTCDIVEAVGYVNVHVFRFSVRRGTAAARMANQVSGDIKRARAARLMERWDETLTRVLDNRIGSTQHVLVEEHRGNVLYGYSHDYLHTTFRADRRIPVGSIVPVRITGREHAAMRGVSDHRIDAR